MSPIPDDPNQAQAWISGEAPDQTIDFYIPRGNRGPQGLQGPMGPSPSVGLVETNMGAPLAGVVGPQGPIGLKGDPGGFTVGTVIATSADWNTLTTDGIYRISGQTGQLNAPPVQLYGMLYVNQVDIGTRINQIYFPGTTGTQGRAIWMRGLAGGIWQPWRSFMASRIDQTAGRAIYQYDIVNERDQLIYGDTGQRDVIADSGWTAALFPTGIVANASNIARVRRIGQEVELVFAADKAASGGLSATGAFPLGFRPASVVHALGANSSMGLIRAYHGGGGGVLGYNSSAGVTAATIYMKFTTADAWPTSLPGSAVGGIPNT